MQLPHWLVGESLSEPEPLDSYVVSLKHPVFVAKVTQKRGWKLMLTVRASGKQRTEDWFRRLEEGAHYWAEQVFQDGPGRYKETPPEILEREDLVLPRFLLCDDEGLERVFVVHTGDPFLVVEVEHGRVLKPAFIPEQANLPSQVDEIAALLMDEIAKALVK